MSKKTVNILLDDVQYQCCGEQFKIGEYIFWSVTKFNNDCYISVDNTTIDYSYEECFGGKGNIVGKVINIILLKKKNNTDNDNTYVKYKTFTNGNDLRLDKDFDATLIVLEDVEYKAYTETYKLCNFETLINLVEKNDITLKLAKNLKQNNKSFTIYDTKEQNIQDLENTLNKIKGFAFARCIKNDLKYLKNINIYSSSDKNKWICFDKKIYKNIIKLAKKQYGNKIYDIYYIDTKQKIIELTKITIYLDLKKIKDLVKIETYKETIENKSFEKIYDYLINN